MFQQMLGVCGASLVSPDWLVLGVTVGTPDLQTLKIRHYNVIPDLHLLVAFSSSSSVGFWADPHTWDL